MEKVIEKIKEFFTENPHYLGLVFAAIGVFLLFAAIKNPDWLLGNVNRLDYSLKTYDGWQNMFGKKIGRTMARISMGISGISLIFGGLVWFFVSTFYHT
jgi:hypothetical protein